MTSTLYATFKTPEEAEQAYAELVHRGAGSSDMLVVTKHTYRDPAFDADAERFELPEPIWLEDDFAPSSFSTVSEGDEGSDPFTKAEGDVWLVDKLRFPGDLTKWLKDFGFSRSLAYGMEVLVLDGGAILLIGVPTGQVDNVIGSQVLERHRGKILAPVRENPYLG